MNIEPDFLTHSDSERIEWAARKSGNHLMVLISTRLGADDAEQMERELCGSRRLAVLRLMGLLETLEVS